MIVNDSKSIVSEFSEFFGLVAEEIDKKIAKSNRTYTEIEIWIQFCWTLSLKVKLKK